MPSEPRRAKGPANRRQPSHEARRPARSRKIGSAARRRAILDAALMEFAERGFEAARLDDVAARAGIAKGTLYLYFADKEELFEAVVLGAVSPIVERLGMLLAAPDIPTDELLEILFSIFEKEILGTERKLLLRLIIAEGPRFPHLAEIYYRNVVSKVLPLIARMADRAAKKGELSTDAIARHPQLVAAPLLLAVIWDGLFAAIEPLDVRGLFRAHQEVLTGKARGRSS